MSRERKLVGADDLQVASKHKHAFRPWYLSTIITRYFRPISTSTVRISPAV
jgi:hypothetical protein